MGSAPMNLRHTALAREHTHEGKCWCDPLSWMICPECEGEGGPCWRCACYVTQDPSDGRPAAAGLVPHDGSDACRVTIHRSAGSACPPEAIEAIEAAKRAAMLEDAPAEAAAPVPSEKLLELIHVAALIEDAERTRNAGKLVRLEWVFGEGFA